MKIGNGTAAVIGDGSYTWKSEDYDDQNSDVGLGSQYNNYTTRRLGANLFAKWLPGGRAVILSADAWRETYETEDLLQKQNPTESTRTAGSLGLQDSIFLFQESLVVTPACRYTLVMVDVISKFHQWAVPAYRDVS